MPTITGYAVTPVVGMVSTSAELVIDKTEVEYAFEVPLVILLDAANDVRGEWTSGNESAHGGVSLGRRAHLGLTAFMIRILRKKLLKQ